ncbi:hypothetical protein LMG27198_21170 [Methylocystis echinoides]|uniref:Uncharacterized protein n=2 Tax=Methylocystis echinoides TaxID=29468 RepID=A0A9W6LRZ2_9HYPH|nr:hypothetical protein LMG27198_21170 [Methylocystis echinoides]
MHNIPGNGANQKIIRVYDRCFVAMKFGGVIVPFYLSSGLSPKEGVAPGKWYPFFGVGRDHDWINKDAEMMVNYYNSPKLAKICKLLDEDFGDLREDGSIEEMSGFSEEVRELLNSDMRAGDFIYDKTGMPVVDEEGVNYVTSDFLAPSISALTTLIDASNADERGAAATRLAELDFQFRGNTGRDDSFISARRTHYLTVEDPIAISSEQTAAQPEQEEKRAQKS